jgi:glycosyltransferase involved in cell wall biosynthesis
MNVSVLILTRNEELTLPDCLHSVAWSDDVVVFDSVSTDRTREIALLAGARYVQRQFDDYASQRNAALRGVAFRNPWVLMVDADERVSAELAHEVLEKAGSAAADTALFRVRRKDIFLGRWLRHSSGYPTWFGRMVRPEQVVVKRAINEEYHTIGAVGRLENHLIHFPFSKGFAAWLERHNLYSTMEATALREERAQPILVSSLFGRDPVRRRRTLKQIAYRLPLRPGLLFVYLYIFRLGFLDGGPGFKYCLLRSGYEYLINLKLLEMRRRDASLAD